MKRIFTLFFIIALISSFTIWQDIYLDEIDTNDNNQQLLENDNLDNEIPWWENNLTLTDDTDDEINNNLNDYTDEYTSDDESNDQKKYWLGDIVFWFCNEWDENLSKSLNYAISQWKPFDVCILFYNSAPQDLKIKVRIVDQELTAQWDPTCNYSSKKIQQFIPQESLDDLEEITLPAGEYVKKVFQLNFPIWVEWNLESCLSYYIPKDSNEMDEWAWFSVIINDWFFMHFFVWGVDSIKNSILFNDLSAFKDDNWELNLKFNLINTWNLEDKIIINGTISNIFWFHKEFTIDWNLIQVKPGDIVPVSAVLWSLPSYGWLYNIEFTATATPFFSYDISNSSIDPTLLEPKEFTASTTFFQMPWLIIVIVIILILLIITIFRKPKEKVVYVQNPQQPMPNPGYQQPQYQAPQQPVQPQYQEPQVAQPQYQQPSQPNQNPNNYWQPNQ